MCERERRSEDVYYIVVYCTVHEYMKHIPVACKHCPISIERLTGDLRANRKTYMYNVLT